MSDKEKLDVACKALQVAIKKSACPAANVSKKWVEFALRGSIQSRKAKYRY